MWLKLGVSVGGAWGDCGRCLGGVWLELRGSVAEAWGGVAGA